MWALETMEELRSDVVDAKSSKWSVTLKEPVGLKLYDGIYSSSPVLTAHSATDSVQPGSKPAFYLSSFSHIRIDVSYPTTTLGTIGFSYAAIRFLKGDESCNSNEFLCGALTASESLNVAGNVMSGGGLDKYCIRNELVCDGFQNCVAGEDESEASCSSGNLQFHT